MPIDLLSTREVPGYPDLEVTLFVDQQGEQEKYAVVVRDRTQVTQWDTTTRKEAADRYFHPFCYGYEYPQRITWEDVEPRDDGA